MSKYDFYRPMKYADAIKVNRPEVERERAVRLYCTQAGDRWALQVRTPMRLEGGREGKDFIVADISMSRDDMKALRDAINLLLREK